MGRVYRQEGGLFEGRISMSEEQRKEKAMALVIQILQQFEGAKLTTQDARRILHATLEELKYDSMPVCVPKTAIWAQFQTVPEFANCLDRQGQEEDALPQSRS
jgi:hypothetical protein